MQKDRKDYEVYFVLGVAHSGTTILYRLLGRHPDLAWFSQFSQRGGTIPGRIQVPLWGWINRCGRRIFSVPWQKRKGWDRYVVPRPMEANTIWEYLLPSNGTEIEDRQSGRNADDITPEMVQRFDQVFRAELDAWNRSKIISKLPRLTRDVNLLSEILPSSKFIHVIRDGRAVALSDLHKFERHYEGLEALRQAARHWKKTVRRVEDEFREGSENHRLKTIRLEDFQSDPRDIFDELLEFLGLGANQYPFPLPDIRENTNEKWKERTTSDQLEILETELGETLSKFNYEASWQ